VLWKPILWADEAEGVQPPLCNIQSSDLNTAPNWNCGSN